MGQNKKKVKEENTTLAKNKKAFHDFEIVDRYEAGITLMGSEVKSVKEGRVSIKESYGKFIKGELYLISMHIAEYMGCAAFNHETLRERKLLLHKKELRKLRMKVETAGMTIVPLRVYRKKHLIKVEVALVRGKREFEKRATIKERENKREIDRAMKAFRNRM